MGGCMGQKVGLGQMTNLIKLELINIIWFSLKIYNLLRHPYLWVDGCVSGWALVKPLKSNKSWPNWDNSIMDILDILLDILLKPPQPLMGLFFFFPCIFAGQALIVIIVSCFLDCDCLPQPFFEDVLPDIMVKDSNSSSCIVKDVPWGVTAEVLSLHVDVETNFFW